MNSKVNTLSDKIQTLTDEQLSEVESFVEFLMLRATERALTHAATAVSAPVFEGIWNCSEDDVYDAL